MDRVFILIVHDFYLCFCSSLISLHSLRHISSQSICGTKPKRPILPTSATGGQASPRCNGAATLLLRCFSPCRLSDLDSEWGSRGFWDQNWSFHFPKFFLIDLSFLTSLNSFSNWLFPSLVAYNDNICVLVSQPKIFLSVLVAVENLLDYQFQRQKLKTNLKAS